MHTKIKQDNNAQNQKIISGEDYNGEYTRQYSAQEDEFLITTKYKSGRINRILYTGEINYTSPKNLEISDSSTLSQYTEATWQPSITIGTINSYTSDVSDSKTTDSELLISYLYKEDHPFTDGDHDDFWEHGGLTLTYSSVSPDLSKDGIGGLSLDEWVENYDNDPLAKPTSRPKTAGKLKLDAYFPNEWWLNPFSTKKNSSNSNDSKGKHSITLPESFKKKSADKITNFNPSTDTLEIDTDSFSIGSSATFATGANKKGVKKVLAKQDFDFLFDEKKGGLYFNENGADKGFGEGGIIAILKGAPDLTSGNLEFI